MSVSAAAAAYQKFTFIAPITTMNSPTKPLVPGRPEFAIANSMKKAANTGIVFTTPAVVRDQVRVHAIVDHTHAEKQCARHETVGDHLDHRPFDAPAR